MSAKEMFEKLGFNSRKESYKDNKLIEIQYANYGKGDWITISLEKIEYVEKRNRTDFIPINLLQAINKQVEELHWNDETTKI